MKKFGRISLTFLLVVAGAFIAVFTYSTFFSQPKIVKVTEEQAARYVSFPADSEQKLPDLTFAAEKSIHAVVHITTKSVRTGQWSSGNPFLDEFFGFRSQPQERQGSGSGVIMSKDGFIVTNNHVVENAQEIKVVLNDKREFEARVVGTDPSTDIALLKVEAEDLPFLTYGNSENLKLGEWVLAVGNPFNLNSTVTAGIVSAQARNLGINRQNNYSIESFIQTDAAVNPGNSGGALVNQHGNLVGINTAIYSRTGSYTGYSFAVPVSIVKKVVKDLKEFGEVQRALLGVTIGDVNAQIAEELNLDRVEGVYVGEVGSNSAAEDAGIESEDVIIRVGGEKTKTSAQLQEKISQYRPGDDVEIVVIRDNEEKQFTVTLRNKHGDTEIVRDNMTLLGAEFETVNENVKRQLNIENGIIIRELNKGKLRDAGLKEGFIITNVNKKAIYEVKDFKREIGNSKGGILIEGIYPNGKPDYVVIVGGR